MKIDLEPTFKKQFIQRLEQQGYAVTKDAKAKGKSGAEHVFDMIASKDDGLTAYSVAVGIAVSNDSVVGLGSIFNFDGRVYDAGIPYKAFLAIPKLADVSANFAQKQRITVFTEEDVYNFINATASPLPDKEQKKIEFANKAQFLESLTAHGYKIEQEVRVKGNSGVEYGFDVLARIDDGLVNHKVGIDFLSADDEVSLEQVSLFDTKSYDVGLPFKMVIASPKLSQEARKFAKNQRIKFFEVSKEALEELPENIATDTESAVQSRQGSAEVKTDEQAPDEPTVDKSLSGIAKLNVLLQAPSPDALQLIPEKMARKYNVVPLAVEENTLRVAMVEPDNILAIEALAARTKKRIEPMLAPAVDIIEAIDFNYRAFGDIAKQFGSVEMSAEPVALEKIAAEIADDSPVAKALNLLSEEALKSRASDIHVEPEIDRLRVRYRIDGILHEVTSLPLGTHAPLISRIKILSGMNIADPRRPQDGQFSFTAKGRDIDVRVATISTVHGEMAVLRLLDKSMAVLSLSQLGFLPDSQEKFERILMAPYGMVLLSGPTGAGKTTTLYAAVNSLDRVGRNIVTIEDPVEYRFGGINQIQINPKAGLTFASGLRAIVRLDPDVILVGEIRDRETADIATQSALTGHLMLSSVHANDTVGVLFRLIDLDIEPFLICSAVIGIVAQRMVRRICPHCGRNVTAPLAEQEAYQRETGEERSEFNYGAGCKACTYTGYLGRTGIFEILQITDEIKRLLLSGATAAEIRNKAIEEGMVSLAKDGMLKARDGITTPYEVLRNAYSVG